MTQQLKFGSTVIYVDDDVGVILDFYRRAFGLETRFYDPNHEFGELETGGPSLAFATHRTGQWLMPGGYPRPEGGPPAGVEVAFFCPDVAAAFQRAVDAGAVALSPPQVMPWGANRRLRSQHRGHLDRPLFADGNLRVRLHCTPVP